MLEEYLQESDEKMQNLKSFINSGDLKNYEILIHSLKSTSAMIGADKPSKIAQELELAAKNGDKDSILANHESFIREYTIVLDAIRKAIPSDAGNDEFEIGDNGAMEFNPE